MGEAILSGIQIAVSIWEMWICHKFLFLTVLDEKNIEVSEKKKMIFGIIVIGCLVGINRLNCFFSNSVFLLQIIFTILIYTHRKSKKLLISGIIILSLTLIAVVDMIFAFGGMEFLQDAFKNEVYLYFMTWPKVSIFIGSRLMLTFGLVLIKKFSQNLYDVSEECKYIILGSGTVLCILLLRYQYFLNNMVLGNLDKKGMVYSISLLLCAFIVICGCMIVVKYYVVKKEKETLLLSEQLLEKRYMDIAQHYQVMHDMKNHLLLIKKYAKEGRNEEICCYLDEISKGDIIDASRIWTGNAVVDLILNSKKTQAESEGIKVSYVTDIIRDIPFTRREVISLFGNLLDNAIEACEKMETTEKWIYLKIIQHNKLIYIEVENSITDHPRKRNGKIVSSKEKKELHGYGIKNIKTIVNNYEGLYSCEILEHSFITKISIFDYGLRERRNENESV